MKKVITTEKIPIKLWLDDIEEGALVQARNQSAFSPLLPDGFADAPALRY